MDVECLAVLSLPSIRTCRAIAIDTLCFDVCLDPGMWSKRLEWGQRRVDVIGDMTEMLCFEQWRFMDYRVECDGACPIRGRSVRTPYGCKGEECSIRQRSVRQKKASKYEGCRGREEGWKRREMEDARACKLRAPRIDSTHVVNRQQSCTFTPPYPEPHPLDPDVLTPYCRPKVLDV